MNIQRSRAVHPATLLCQGISSMTFFIIRVYQPFVKGFQNFIYYAGDAGYHITTWVGRGKATSAPAQGNEGASDGR